jgi:UDP-N-acetylmuramoyl-L-alanyl-D-glutamate--2,6-diaminopimelate ligase
VMGWTNLSPEHLDLHGTFEAYREAKLALVRSAEVAVLNRDDPAYPHFAAVAERGVSVGFHPEADVRAEGLEERDDGWRFTLMAGGERHPAHLPMLGRYNVSNALVALAAAEVLGVPLPVALPRLASFAGVPGRMQRVQQRPFAVVVDFAHTPPALAAALAALRPAQGRLAVVIGAPGERDSAKRGELGAIAVQAADYAIFTEDDTRSESLTAILATIEGGAVAAGGVEGRDYHVIPDRRTAIRAAVAWAEAGDVVLLAAKGHEQTLKRRSGDIPWDEVAEAHAAIAARRQGA